MQFKKPLLIICSLSILLNAFSQEIKSQTNFRSPVDIPIYLSGNFGEIRSTHFHAGIDIKTQGVIGKKIYAVEEGYVSRIKISTNGYGKTLYIQHPNGYTSVYGHLDKFNKDISKRVKEIQYDNNEFEINYFPKPDEFPVNKGDIIAYSGNTGSSMGPHLHFEIRETNDQIPLNPLKFNFDIKDNISPLLYTLVIYPLNNKSTVNNQHSKHFFRLKKSNNVYAITDTNSIILSGDIGFGIEMYDYLNGSRNKCGIYTLSVLVDSSLIYYHTIDKFSFYETGYVKSHIDYAEKVKSKRTIQKTFISPNNNLSIYKTDVNNGAYSFNKDTLYNIQLVATDVYGNKSELAFNIRGSLPDTTHKINSSQKDFMDWKVANIFENEEIKINIPAKALFDTIYFKYSKSDPDFKAYSNIHHIHNIYTPLYKNYSLSIKTKNLPQELYDKALIAELLDDEFNPINSDVINGFIVGETNTFGDYVVLVDSIAPEIKSLNNFNELKEKTIQFIIKDDLSGIKSYNAYIDSNWALFEYDEKNDLLFYEIDTSKLVKGNEHELELFVIDKKNNISTFYTTFNW